MEKAERREGLHVRKDLKADGDENEKQTRGSVVVCPVMI